MPTARYSSLPALQAETVDCLSLDSDGEVMVSGGADHLVKVWGFDDGRQVHSGPSAAKGWHTASTRAGRCGRAATLAAMDQCSAAAAEGACHWMCFLCLSKHPAGPTSRSCHRHSAGLPVKCADLQFMLTSIRPAHYCRCRYLGAAHSGCVNQVKVTFDKSHIVSAGADGAIMVWKYQAPGTVQALAQ